MARNQEKAQSMLFRFREAQLIDMGMMRDPREKLRVEDVQSIRECEEQRSLLVTDISRKISRINEATMPDHLVRDLNDEINRLLRRKARWEYRIKEMGGPDYRRSAGKILDAQGKEVPGQRGYRYFGKAKDLPGVKELFQQEAPEPPGKSRMDLLRRIDADYYGYRDDDDDGVLIQVEQETERRHGVDAQRLDPMLQHMPLYMSMIPTQQQVEQFLVRRKQQELLDKYAE